MSLYPERPTRLVDLMYTCGQVAELAPRLGLTLPALELWLSGGGAPAFREPV